MAILVASLGTQGCAALKPLLGVFTRGLGGIASPSRSAAGTPRRPRSSSDTRRGGRGTGTNADPGKGAGSSGSIFGTAPINPQTEFLPPKDPPGTRITDRL